MFGEEVPILGGGGKREKKKERGGVERGAKGGCQRVGVGEGVLKTGDPGWGRRLLV
jgi:hypothetical protein